MMVVVLLLLILWFGLLVPSPRGAGWFMQFGIGHFCLGLLLSGNQSGLPCLHLLLVLRTLPMGPTLLVSWLSGWPFLGPLHWPAGGLDLGVGGISYVELLILHELWAGERLSLEKALPRCLRPGRPISVSAVPFGPGIDIWRSCRFIGAMMRCLCLLPGGLGRFVPCSIGANHCRLRHIGWEKCGHGLTSRPRESASEPFLDELLRLFNYPPGSARASRKNLGELLCHVQPRTTSARNVAPRADLHPDRCNDGDSPLFLPEERLLCVLCHGQLVH